MGKQKRVRIALRNKNKKQARTETDGVAQQEPAALGTICFEPITEMPLDEYTITQICLQVRDGVPARDAVWLLGYSENRHHAWMRRGVQAREDLEAGMKLTKEQMAFAVYYREVKKAEAYFRRRCINRSLTVDYFAETWIRDMTILERRDKEHWGRSNDTLSRPEEFKPDDSFL